jgi:hypothetical protein
MVAQLKRAANPVSGRRQPTVWGNSTGSGKRSSYECGLLVSCDLSGNNRTNVSVAHINVRSTIIGTSIGPCSRQGVLASNFFVFGADRNGSSAEELFFLATRPLDPWFGSRSSDKKLTTQTSNNRRSMCVLTAGTGQNSGS